MTYEEAMQHHTLWELLHQPLILTVALIVAALIISRIARIWK